MRKKVVALGLAAAGLVASGLEAQPMRVPQGQWWERPLVVRALGLTAEQRRNIEKATIEHARAMVDLKADVEKAELDVKVAADAEPFEPGQVRAAFQKLLQARMRLETERFEMILKVREVLSAEQWQKLRRLAAERRSRGGGPEGGREEFGRPQGLPDRPLLP
jgi:Spy/CpxP family protein refolding chaperone